MKIFTWFKKKKIEPELIVQNPDVTKIKEKRFDHYCHYCFKGFDIDNLKVYSTKVRSCDGLYYYQGKGYLCPHCFNENIIG